MKQSSQKDLSFTVVAIGLATFFATFSSDMIYPLLPLFLSSMLGAGAFGLGLVEGVAEATASVLKIVSGYLTDRAKRRKPFVIAGYGLSSVVRPLIGMAGTWPVVLWLRFADRTGNGISSSPRDALIADASDHEMSGRAFGFQKAMDYGGSVMGPLAAVFLLKEFGLSLRSVFLFSIFPAAMAMAVLILLVQERRKSNPAASTPSRMGVEESCQGKADQGKAPHKEAYQKEPDHTIRGRNFLLFLLAGIIFSFGRPTDTFLLLRLNTIGVKAANSAALWALFNLIKMISTYVGGRVSDRVGRKPMIMAGWIYYAVTYLLFAHLQGKGPLTGVFLLHGVYFGFTEPAERAWIASFVSKNLRGRAFGYYSGATGITTLPSSLLFGLIWQKWGYQYAFMIGMAFALLGCIVISMVKVENEPCAGNKCCR
ncbi:MAG: MFS transporter [bacterium]